MAAEFVGDGFLPPYETIVSLYLAKLQYFTNLDLPEIAGDWTSQTLPFGGPGRVRSLELDKII